MLELAKTDPIIGKSLDIGLLKVLPTGGFSPCLDLNRINERLVVESQDADLVIIEGMGRAIHTNLKCQMSCDLIKIAVFKNQFIAKQLGVESCQGMVIYEEAGKNQ